MRVVRVHHGQDALEVQLALPVLAQAVAHRDEAALELVPVEAARARLVEVVERGAVFVQLLLADALAVTRQDLILNLVDVPGGGGG